MLMDGDWTMGVTGGSEIEVASGKEVGSSVGGGGI